MVFEMYDGPSIIHLEGHAPLWCHKWIGLGRRPILTIGVNSHVRCFFKDVLEASFVRTRQGRIWRTVSSGSWGSGLALLFSPPGTGRPQWERVDPPLRALRRLVRVNVEVSRQTAHESGSTQKSSTITRRNRKEMHPNPPLIWYHTVSKALLRHCKVSTPLLWHHKVSKALLWHHKVSKALLWHHMVYTP